MSCEAGTSSQQRHFINCCSNCSACRRRTICITTLFATRKGRNCQKASPVNLSANFGRKVRLRMTSAKGSALLDQKSDAIPFFSQSPKRVGSGPSRPFTSLGSLTSGVALRRSAASASALWASAESGFSVMVLWSALIALIWGLAKVLGKEELAA